MKVFEILRNDIKAPSEAELNSALAKVNWKYEFSDNEYERRQGEKMMEKIENMVYQSYKLDPSKTLLIWHKHCPWAKKLDESVVPDFILRFQTLDANPKLNESN